MAKLRDDLDGVVYVGGTAYKAGDTLPADAPVSDGLVAAEPKSPVQPARKRTRSPKED